jgi:hypothetical protein
LDLASIRGFFSLDQEDNSKEEGLVSFKLFAMSFLA